MNAYLQMRERQQKEFNEFPMKFAFSNEQFAEGMRELGLLPSDTDKVFAAPAGGFYRKEDAPKLAEMMKRHRKELSDAIAADTTGEGFIYQMFRCELENHEYDYTGDISDTLEALGYTMEDIEQDERLASALELARHDVMKYSCS